MLCSIDPFPTASIFHNTIFTDQPYKWEKMFEQTNSMFKKHTIQKCWISVTRNQRTPADNFIEPQNHPTRPASGPIAKT